jgi:orotidine-5'-phosphate decarboxylase
LNFDEKLNYTTEKNNSLLCVGLDPDLEQMPPKLDVFKFNKAIIDATSELVCAYKLNFAFYEALDDGIDILKRTIKAVPEHIPVIGDGKRGDIGNTARAYAHAVFVTLGCDATTVNPYLGFDSIEPFIGYWDKGVFIVCRTSNPGAVDFQNLRFETEKAQLALFEIVAIRAALWNKQGNIGLVVGATYPDELKLIPGIGAQGGDLASSVRYGVNATGRKAILTSSRQIIYASQDKDYAEAARRVAADLRERINYYRSTLTLAP